MTPSSLEAAPAVRLGPCPFCSGPAIIVHTGAWNLCRSGYCQSCEIYGPMQSTEEKAIAAWNTRHGDALLRDRDQTIAGLEKQLRNTQSALEIRRASWQMLHDNAAKLEQSLAQVEARVGELLDALKELSKECESVLDIHPEISQWSIRSALQTADLLLSKGEAKGAV